MEMTLDESAAFVTTWMGNQVRRKKWIEALRALVAHGPAARDAMISIAEKGLALEESPRYTTNIVAFTWRAVADALVTVAPDDAARVLAPWLGNPRILFQNHEMDRPTLLDRLVALGDRARPAAEPLLRWANTKEIPRWATEVSAARAALDTLGIPRDTPYEPMEPKLVAAIEALGGRLGPPRAHTTLSPLDARFASVVWPEGVSYANKEGKSSKRVWVWSLRWLGLHEDTPAIDLGWGMGLRTATIAHADGGNYSVHMTLDVPNDPWVFKTEHDREPGESVTNGMTMSAFLQSLKPEKSRRAPRKPR